MLNHKNKSKSDIVIHCNYFKDNFSMKYSGYNVQDPHLQIISRIMQFRPKKQDYDLTLIEEEKKHKKESGVY